MFFLNSGDDTAHVSSSYLPAGLVAHQHQRGAGRQLAVGWGLACCAVWPWPRRRGAAGEQEAAGGKQKQQAMHSI